MKFEEKLQSLRKEKGWSQEELGEKVGVSRQAISKWEGGQSLPEMENLMALRDIFDITLDELVSGEEKVKEEKYIETKTVIIGRPFWEYEYKSKRTLFNMPLVHINIGRGFKKAKGVLAVGTIATGICSVGIFSRGIISLGILGVGVFSLGTLSLGLAVALGAIAIGTVAVGAVAVGVFALGALSLGVYSVGACALSLRIAIGDYARGEIAVGRVAKGAVTFVDTSPHKDFSLINAQEVRTAINSRFPHIWKWAENVLMWVIGG